ncbi:flagellar protein FlgJ [Sphingobium fontiphilum]|uniref:Flagellar protein FlgJ n=1 Tax=Sphingobium fontiphilum TaxID=944425 RepID=A0A7W6GPH3_9SPHN|nr:rod-binding protein [Sphingobium fontiphilum]MBB3982413.1 flagellar protein FlgJ [Sphingobium fontiphilum]
MQISSSFPTAQATPGSGRDKAALKQAAQAFEAIFVRQMIGAMRSASLAEGIADSSATEQFRDMADAQTAQSLATSGSLGIADLLLQQFGATLTKPATATTDTDKAA